KALRTQAIGHNWSVHIFNFVQHLDDVRATHVVDAEFADTGFNKSLECALVNIRATQRLIFISHMPNHEVIQNGRHRDSTRGRSALFEWILPAVDALAQIPGLANSL